MKKLSEKDGNLIRIVLGLAVGFGASWGLHGPVFALMLAGFAYYAGQVAKYVARL